MLIGDMASRLRAGALAELLLTSFLLRYRGHAKLS